MYGKDTTGPGDSYGESGRPGHCPLIYHPVEKQVVTVHGAAVLVPCAVRGKLKF